MLPRTPLDNYSEGVAILTDVVRDVVRALGPEHPQTATVQEQLALTRAWLNAARYQDEEWRGRYRCQRALIAHVDAMDELLAARGE